MRGSAAIRPCTSSGPGPAGKGWWPGFSSVLLPAPFAPDHRDAFAVVHGEGNLAQGMKPLGTLGTQHLHHPVANEQLAGVACEGPPHVEKRIAGCPSDML